MKSTSGLAFELASTSDQNLIRIDRWLKKL